MMDDDDAFKTWKIAMNVMHLSLIFQNISHLLIQRVSKSRLFIQTKEEKNVAILLVIPKTEIEMRIWILIIGYKFFGDE